MHATLKKNTFFRLKSFQKVYSLAIAKFSATVVKDKASHSKKTREHIISNSIKGDAKQAQNLHDFNYNQKENKKLNFTV